MSFLKAEWRQLALANYEIDPDLLKPYMPWGTELDVWEGTNYVSLVGFMFLNTRMLGMKIPFHVNFEEVNLRFYVRRKEGKEWKRGVVFIRELVPRPALAFVANTLYKERYLSVPMDHRWAEGENNREVEYSWKMKGRSHRIYIDASLTAVPMEAGSEEEFITEHYWGYARVSEKKTFEYEVTHPRWYCYPVNSYEVDVDFGKVYGPEFDFLNQATPKSVMLAQGSEITVENKRTIR